MLSTWPVSLSCPWKRQNPRKPVLYTAAQSSGCGQAESPAEIPSGPGDLKSLDPVVSRVASDQLKDRSKHTAEAQLTAHLCQAEPAGLSELVRSTARGHLLSIPFHFMYKLHII